MLRRLPNHKLIHCKLKFQDAIYYWRSPAIPNWFSFNMGIDSATIGGGQHTLKDFCNWAWCWVPRTAGQKEFFRHWLWRQASSDHILVNGYSPPNEKFSLINRLNEYLLILSTCHYGHYFDILVQVCWIIELWRDTFRLNTVLPVNLAFWPLIGLAENLEVTFGILT